MEKFTKKEGDMYTLAITQADIEFKYTRGRLTSLVIKPSKVLELIGNGLLTSRKENGYTKICILRGLKQLIIPIKSDSWRFSKKTHIKKGYVTVTNEVHYHKQDMREWLINGKKPTNRIMEENNEEKSNQSDFSNPVI